MPVVTSKIAIGTIAPVSVAGVVQTWNPSDKDAGITLSNGNRTATRNATSAPNWSAARGLVGLTSGKWSWELAIGTDSAGNVTVGIADALATLANFVGSDVHGWAYHANGQKYHTGVNVAYGAAYAAGDIIGVALDIDAGTLTFYKNNVSQGVAYSGLSGTLFPAMSLFNQSDAVTVNFGASALAYPPPAGFTPISASQTVWQYSAQYSFPAGFRLVSRDQPTKLDELKIPYLDGSQIPDGTRDTKVIAIAGTIGGSGAVDSGGNYITTRDQAEAEANLLSSYLAAGTLALSVGAAPARTILAKKSKSTFTYDESTAQCVIGCALEFKAPDPRWLALAASTVGPIGGAGIVAALQTVGGSATTFPVATLVGAYNNPIVMVYPGNGTGRILLQLGYQMLAGDTIVIDCDPRNRESGVLLNGAKRLDLINTTASLNTYGDAAFFPYLIPGANLVYVCSFNGTTPGTSASVTWREAYLY
jgi:hypothetical protein